MLAFFNRGVDDPSTFADVDDLNIEWLKTAAVQAAKFAGVILAGPGALAAIVIFAFCNN